MVFFVGKTPGRSYAMLCNLSHFHPSCWNLFQAVDSHKISDFAALSSLDSCWPSVQRLDSQNEHVGLFLANTSSPVTAATPQLHTQFQKTIQNREKWRSAELTSFFSLGGSPVPFCSTTLYWRPFLLGSEPSLEEKITAGASNKLS